MKELNLRDLILQKQEIGKTRAMDLHYARGNEKVGNGLSIIYKNL
jgi:hypothetical protein